LQQHHLAAVQVGADRQPADLFGSQLQRPLRGPELLPQPDVLLGQLAVLAPRRGQLVLQAGDGLLQGRLVRRHRTVRRARLRAGRGQPPDHLHQQAPGQLVVVEPVRGADGPGAARAARPGRNPASPDSPAGPGPANPAGPGSGDPGDTGDPGNTDPGDRGTNPARDRHADPGSHAEHRTHLGHPRRSQADPVGTLSPHLALDQPRTFHTRQQLRERHAGPRVPDRGGQLRTGHPVDVRERAGLGQVRDDAFPRPDSPLPGSSSPNPHGSTFSPPMAIMPADDLMIVRSPVQQQG